ncbi:MAG: PQQ-binding-like beta-propeller repeat protein [Prolixibacteraceae bacterium]|nr:PQQ-binding-like beta-propeller repeat protein [Prolixibacteraceae bacterium]
MMNKTVLPVIFISLIILVGCISKKTNEWSKWRGPNADGKISSDNFNPEKLDSVNIVWTKDIGFGHSAITVSNGKCYASGWKEEVIGNDTVYKSAIYCLKVDDGSEIWTYNYPSAKRSYPGPRSTPVIDANRLYSLSWEGKLFCLKAKTGEEIWQIDLAKDSLTISDQWGYNTSPVIYDDLILLNLNRHGIALDKKTGDVVWNSDTTNSHFSSVQLIDINDSRLGVFMSDSSMFFVVPETGKVVFSHKRLSLNGMENDVMVTDAGKLFTSNASYEMMDNGLVLEWQNDTVSSSFRTGLVMGNHAYQFSLERGNKSRLNCVNLETGVPAWRENFGRWGALIAVNEYLVIINGLGKVIVAEATPEAYKPIKELQVLTSENKPENWCWTIPTFTDGKLFVRNSKGEMACIDLSI